MFPFRMKSFNFWLDISILAFLVQFYNISVVSFPANSIVFECFQELQDEWRPHNSVPESDRQSFWIDRHGSAKMSFGRIIPMGTALLLASIKHNLQDLYGSTRSAPKILYIVVCRAAAAHMANYFLQPQWDPGWVVPVWVNKDKVVMSYTGERQRW